MTKRLELGRWEASEARSEAESSEPSEVNKEKRTSMHRGRAKEPPLPNTLAA